MIFILRLKADEHDEHIDCVNTTASGCGYTGGPMMKRILIVDDENLILYSLSSALRQDDTYIKAVACGKDAVNEAAHVFYQLCFLDINLPDINGLEVMKSVKKISPATKIVIMTGGVVDSSMLKFIQEKAVLLIPKPFDLDRIKTFVDRVLGREPGAQQQAGTSCNRSEDRAAFENWIMDGMRLYAFC